MNTEIKRLNRQKILKYIFSTEATSRPQIAYDLRMSMPTVLQNIRDLQKLGLVTQAGQYQSTGGRKAAMIKKVPDAQLAAGIDITRNHIGFVLVDLAGNILRHSRVGKPYVNAPEYYRELGNMTASFIRNEAAENKLLGIGVSIPGILNEDASFITYSHALGIRDLSCRVISDHISWPCHFMNDANAAGMAELRAAGYASTMVYLSLSNTVGGSIFINGRLFKGMNQRGGEFGHIQLVPGGKRCYCGQYGCVDAYCSSLVLSRPFSGRLETFFERLQQRDPPCLEIWGNYLDHLALTVHTLRMIFDCTVVLGGYVGGFLEPWADALQRRVSRLNPFEDGEKFLRICRFRQEASAFGTAMQSIDNFIEQL